MAMCPKRFSNPPRRILVCSADRAEKGLLEPVMVELQKRDDVEAEWCFLFPWNEQDYESILGVFSYVLHQFKPHIILVPTDRWEMVYVAAYAFHNNYAVAHFHAGDFGSEHPDEMNRRAISCFSHIMFCNDARSQTALWRLGEERWRTFLVGSTAFDHVVVDESLCPKESYVLVLLHPDPVSREVTHKNLEWTTSYLANGGLNGIWEKTIWLRPNKDQHHKIIDDFLDKVTDAIIYDNLPRSQFLGLLKNCKRFIGNSSAIGYEAPFFGVKTVHIGKRNRNRNFPNKIVTRASEKIAEILATIPLDDKLRRKRFLV